MCTGSSLWLAHMRSYYFHFLTFPLSDPYETWTGQVTTTCSAPHVSQCPVIGGAHKRPAPRVEAHRSTLTPG